MKRCTNLSVVEKKSQTQGVPSVKFIKSLHADKVKIRMALHKI